VSYTFLLSVRILNVADIFLLCLGWTPISILHMGGQNNKMLYAAAEEKLEILRL
jgi:hypothetical protein